MRKALPIFPRHCPTDKPSSLSTALDTL